MADFEVAIELIKHSEGGYWKGFSDKFVDKGGETYQGIARNFHPKWNGWAFIDNQKKVAPIEWQTKFTELDGDVEEFYLVSFWNPLLLSEVKDQAVADSIMDMAVNLGAGTVVGKVQMMLNKRWNQALKVDAVMGPKTIEVINSLPANQLNISLFKMRVRHHIKNANPEILVPLIERCMTYLVG